MRIILTIAIGLILSGHIIAQATDKYSPDELKEDLDYLYSTLKETHYNLYVNTPETEYQKAFEKLMLSIDDSLDILNVYRKFQPFVALSELSHCTMDFPFSRAYGSYFQNGGKLFPLNITIKNDKGYITGNYSGNDSLIIGAEIISINSVPLQNKFTEIYKYLSGEDEYIKSTFLDMVSFPRMLWILEETESDYYVTIKHNDSQYTISVKSILASDFEAEFSEEKQIFDSEREFKIIDEISYIKPGPFMNANANGNTSDVNSFQNNEFVNFIDSAFLEIHNGEYNKLIIDLRNNAGGSNTFSDEMLAYVADKPFKFCSKFEIKTSQITKGFWKQVEDSSLLKKQILSHDNGEIFISEIPYHDPKTDSLRFKGKVYVLINKYSYSQATVTAAMIKDYEFGTLIGEKTADIPTTYASVHQFELPNSKIPVTYPKAFMIRPNGVTELKGTEPDIRVEPDMFTDKDEILDYAIEYIKADK